MQQGSAAATVSTGVRRRGAATGGVVQDEHATRARAGARVVDVVKEVTQRTCGVTAEQLDDVLGSIARELRELLHVGRCTIYLVADDGRLQLRAGDGELGRTPAMGAPVGRDLASVSRRLVETAAPIVQGMRWPASAPPHRAGARHSGRVLAARVSSGDQVLGAVFVEEWSEGQMTPSDLVIVETFAGLVALAVRAARHSSELAVQAAVIERQKAAFEELIDSQHLVERAVREGADTAELVRVLAGRVGKPVAFYDAELRVVTTSADDAERRRAIGVLPGAVNRLDWVRRTIRKLDGSQRSTVLPPTVADGLAWRHLVCAVTVGTDVVGFVVVLEIGRRLSVHDLRLTDHVATALGMRARFDRHDGEAAAWLGGRLVDDLLAGRADPEERQRRAAAIGIDLDGPHVLVRVEPRGGELAAAAGEMITTLRAALGPVIVSATADGAVVVLVGARHADADVRAALDDVVARAARAGIDIVTGFATVGREDGDHAAASTALRALLAVAAEPVVALEVGNLLGALVHDGALQLMRLACRDLLAPLVTHDESNDASLVATLRAFLDANGQIREAAIALRVHTNTVRYRLGRIRELSRIDPCRVDSLLEARLALQVLDRR